MNIQAKEKLYYLLGHILGTAQGLEKFSKDPFIIRKGSISIQKDINAIIELFKEDIDN